MGPVRVVMLVLSEVVAAFLHGYSVLVVIRCMSYLYDKAGTAHILNRSFFESLKERVTHRKKANDADEEVVLIDETAAKKDVADKKPKGSSSEEPHRYVHFVDVNTYHDI
ncbi:hypothetical protein AAVH_02432 [Aphelenchoides avenae]|nr:hypothetical protein AAVH_02432 [Aphelenchus avenae]